MRRKARVDSNHSAIVGALRACGWYVHDTSRLGNGWVDLVIAKHGRLRLVEVKNGHRPPSARKTTPQQQKLHAELALAGISVSIIKSVDEALSL